MVPVGNDDEIRAERLDPEGCVVIDEDYRLIIAFPAGKPDDILYQVCISGTNRGTEPGDPAYRAGQNHRAVDNRVPVIGVMVPAYHVGERVVAVSLGIPGIMIGKEGAVLQRDLPEIIDREHLVLRIIEKGYIPLHVPEPQQEIKFF
jgi:hypothetical protein